MILIPTFSVLDAALECYFCSYEEGECGVEVSGVPVNCQMDNPFGKHYGDACYVAHTGKYTSLQFHNISQATTKVD